MIFVENIYHFIRTFIGCVEINLFAGYIFCLFAIISGFQVFDSFFAQYDRGNEKFVAFCPIVFFKQTGKYFLGLFAVGIVVFSRILGYAKSNQACHQNENFSHTHNIHFLGREG